MFALSVDAVDKSKAIVEAQIGNLEDAEAVRRCSVQLQMLWFYGHCSDLRATLSVFGGLRSKTLEFYQQHAKAAISHMFALRACAKLKL